MSSGAPLSTDAPKSSTSTATTPTATATVSASGFGAIYSLLLILPVLFLVAFHAGAGYLSYQKYGSTLWAVVDFMFAYFYYPYYAFFLSAPAPSTGVLYGGKRSVMNLLKMKWK